MNTVIYFKPTWSTQSIHLVLEARGDHGYFHYTVLFSTDTAFRCICRHSFNTLYQLGVFTVDAIKRLTAFWDIYFKCMSSISSNLNKIVPRASTPLGKAPTTIFLYLTFIENVPLFIKNIFELGTPLVIRQKPLPICYREGLALMAIYITSFMMGWNRLVVTYIHKKVKFLGRWKFSF